jgi:nucleoside-diphosphate-sugar epimerase
VNVVFGDGRNLLPLVYVANVVDALVLAARNETTHGRAYNIVDDDEVSQRLYVERMGQARLQQSTVYLPLPAVRIPRRRGRLGTYGPAGPAESAGLFHRITRSLQRVMA